MPRRLPSARRVAATSVVGLLLVAGPVLGSVGRGRAELHVHLDGSIGLEALFRLCSVRGLALPLPAGGNAVPRSVADVARYLESKPGWHRFDVVNDIVGGDTVSIRQAAEAFVQFQADSGVGYTEVRYDPARLSRSSLGNVSIPEEAAVRAVQEGLAAGARKFGVSVFQILCAMRGEPAKRCFEVAALAVRLQSQAMGGVVGLDLAGDESSFPNAPYVSCFRHAKQTLGLRTTVHSGEFNHTSSEEVRSAVVDMLADRVGHGYAAARDPSLLAQLKERNVHMEACPKSAKAHGHWALEAIGTFRETGLNFGLNTDDPVSFIGNTTAVEDELIVKQDLGFTAQDIARAYSSARAAAFGVVPPMDEALQAAEESEILGVMFA